MATGSFTVSAFRVRIGGFSELRYVYITEVIAKRIPGRHGSSSDEARHFAAVRNNNVTGVTPGNRALMVSMTTKAGSVVVTICTPT